MISRFYNKFQTSYVVSWKKDTEQWKDMYLKLSTRRYWLATTLQLTSDLTDASGIRIFKQAIQSCFQIRHLYIRSLVVRTHFNSSKRTTQLFWSLEHQSWTRQERAYFFPAASWVRIRRMLLVEILSGENV